MRVAAFDALVSQVLFFRAKARRLWAFAVLRVVDVEPAVVEPVVVDPMIVDPVVVDPDGHA